MPSHNNPERSEALERLERFYDDAVDSVYDGREALVDFARQELDYREFIKRTYREAGHRNQVKLIDKTAGFAFGSPNPRSDLAFIGSEVEHGARLAGLDVPPAVVGAWPEYGLNARVVSTGDGALILLNVGTPPLLRVAAAFSTYAIGSITGDETWGHDSANTDFLVDQFQRLTVANLDRVDVRRTSPVVALLGPREGLRRALLLGGLLYLVAHEYGHVAQGHRSLAAPTAALVARAIMEPTSESHVLRSQREELEADGWALSILDALEKEGRERRGDGQALNVIHMGMVMVLGLQSASWWRSLVSGSEEYGWTHPPPDVRLGVLPEFELHAPSSVTQRFAEWLWDTLDIKGYMRTHSERRGRSGV
jgi:hypothetical protein